MRSSVPTVMANAIIQLGSDSTCLHFDSAFIKFRSGRVSNAAQSFHHFANAQTSSLDTTPRAIAPVSGVQPHQLAAKWRLAACQQAVRHSPSALSTCCPARTAYRCPHTSSRTTGSLSNPTHYGSFSRRLTCSARSRRASDFVVPCRRCPYGATQPERGHKIGSGNPFPTRGL